MAVAWFAVAWLVMLVSIVGVVVPFLPGLPLVLAGVCLYTLATGLVCAETALRPTLR